MSLITSEQAGYLLNPIDLGLNKLLALVGRDEPRDYLDIHEVIAKSCVYNLKFVMPFLSFFDHNRIFYPLL